MHRRTFLRASSATGTALTAGAALSTSSHARVAAETAPADAGAVDADDEFEPLGSVSAPGAAEAVVSDDGQTVYLATIDGFATVDVSDPADPTILEQRRRLHVNGDERVDEGDGGNETGSSARELAYVFDVEVDGDRLVVPGPGSWSSDQFFHGFLLYDVSDPADPVPAGDPFETDFHIHNCFFEDDLVYLVGNDGERNPLVIVDVGDDDPVEVGRWSLLEFDDRWAGVDPILWYLHDVYVQDGVAYLPYWNAGTYLVDVSDPANPEYVTHVAEADVEDQLEVEPENVTEAQWTLPGNDHYAAVDETGDLLAVGREAWAAEEGDPEGSGGIDLYDVSNPDDPERLSTIEAPETPDASYRGGMWATSHNFELRGGLLFSSWYRGGVKIHDVTDPANPEELAHWQDWDETAFWTARVADDETFVASSTTLVPNTDLEGALYTFPITEEAVASGGDGPGGSGSDPDEENGDGNETDGSTTGTDGDSSPSTDADDGDSNASDGDRNADVIPGFSVPTALAGGGLTLEWIRRRTRTDSSPHDLDE